MFKIALGQMEVIPGRPDRNTATMLTMIAKAKQQQADLIVFPEMAIPGYLLGDTWEQTAFLRDCEEYGRQVTDAAKGICVCFGNVAMDWQKRGHDGRVRKYNAFFIAQDGKLLGDDNFPYPFRVKTLLPNYREFDDTRHFFSLRKLANELRVNVEELLQPVTVTLRGKPVRLGCILCEDGWSDDYDIEPVTLIHQHGPVDFMLNISCSPFTLSKNNKRNRVFSREAAAIGVPLIYVNNTGLQNNGKTVYTFDGFSTVYSETGDIIAYCPPFAATLAYVTLASTGNRLPTLEIPDDNAIDHIYRALHYGISKFLTAIGMTKVVVGISGGVDSAVTAALYAKILAPENVLLVNMPSRYNSETTKSLAAKLAENLGCLYTVMPIQESVDYTIRQLSATPVTDLRHHSEFSLTVSDFATENIQARDRSARVLAGAAAAFGGGFTCNANKSETTVGYSTLYGDQSGFLAALADLWKYQVYALAEYLNQHVYQREVIPQTTLEIVPSAELSFAQAVEEGRGDPIQYPYHEYLFQAFSEHWQRATPEDILTWYQEGCLEKKIGCEAGLVSRLFPAPQDFIADLERWWKLYSGMAVAKRIQAPPILAVSRRAYGFDHREAQNTVYFTRRYDTIKAQLLAAINPR